MNPLARRDGASPDIAQQYAPSLNDDEASRRAQITIETLEEITPHFWRLHDPEERKKLFEELRAAAEEELNPGQKDEPGEEQEKPFDQNEFFNNLEEMRKQIPKRL